MGTMLGLKRLLVQALTNSTEASRVDVDEAVLRNNAAAHKKEAFIADKQQALTKVGTGGTEEEEEDKDSVAESVVANPMAALGNAMPGADFTLYASLHNACVVCQELTRDSLKM